MISKYEKAIKPHVSWFKEQIGKSNDDIIRISIKDLRSEMGNDFAYVHDTTIYSRIRDILLENGIKVKMGHLANKDKLLLMSKVEDSEIVNATDALYFRHKKTAENQGLTYSEYDKKFDYKNYGVLPKEENRGCPLYFGEYIEEKYVSQIFEDPVQFEYPRDDMGRIIDRSKPYDFLCKQGLKIKHAASCLRRKDSGNTEVAVGSIREYWGYLIRRNSVPDYWIFSGWDNRESLEPMYVWMIKRDEKIDNQLVEMKNVPFYSRDTFTIYFNKKGIEKMSKYEVSDKLDKLKIVCDINRMRIEKY